MTTTIGLVLDCTDPDALAPFWAGALDYAILGGAGNYVLLMPNDGDGPKLLLQRVTEAKVGKNRMHFDVHVVDIETEASRLTSLGAVRLDPTIQSEHGTSWILMADPAGNEFCVCDGGTTVS